MKVGISTLFKNVLTNSFFTSTYIRQSYNDTVYYIILCLIINYYVMQYLSYFLSVAINRDKLNVRTGHRDCSGQTGTNDRPKYIYCIRCFFNKHTRL